MKKNIEQWILNSWEEIFNVKNLNVHSDFFDLGGNSLTALKFLSRVEEKFGAESLLPDTLFETPSVAEIANAIHMFLSEEALITS